MAVSLLNAAEFAMLSYECPEAVKEAYRNQEGSENTVLCMKTVTEEPVYLSDPETDMQAYVMKLSGTVPTLLITVRGTSSLIDAFYDVDAITIPLPAASALAPGVRVHEGFFNQFASLAPLLRPLLLDMQAENASFDILCTGHSAGAAIGALASFHLALDHTQKIAYVGFGCPRVGNAAFCDLVNKRLVSPQLIKHGRDPIVKVAQGHGYTKICEEQCYGKFDPYPDLPVLSDLPDHNIMDYIAAIKAGETMRKPGPVDKCIEVIIGWLTDRLKIFK